MTRKVENKEQTARQEPENLCSKETREFQQRLENLRTKSKTARKELESFQKKEQTARKRRENFERDSLDIKQGANRSKLEKEQTGRKKLDKF